MTQIKKRLVRKIHKIKPNVLVDNVKFYYVIKQANFMQKTSYFVWTFIKYKLNMTIYVQKNMTFVFFFKNMKISHEDIPTNKSSGSFVCTEI